MEPKVSIVIPVYNGANYMRDAIDSALNQTYKNCEIIVVNDGSNDNGATDQIAKSYGNKIRYFVKENGGVATAINLGIQNMTGDYFAWLSHDDLFYPMKIQEQLEALAYINDFKGIVFGNFEFWDMNKDEKYLFQIEKLCDETKITKGIYPILFGLIHFCTVLVSRKRIEEVGLCNEKLKTTQDIEWIFRLLRQKESIFLKRPLTIVRLHSMQGKHWIKEYDIEQGKTHIGFLKAITEEEIEELFGDRFTMYQQMATFYKSDHNIMAFEYVKDNFNCIPKPKGIQKQIRMLKDKFLELGEGNIDKICIFCAGYYGKNLLYEFRKRGLTVDFFSDNKESIWGTKIEGIVCIPPVQIDKEHTLIIVALQNTEELLEKLKNSGYKYVISYKKIKKELLNIKPIIIPN